ncbi:T9SS type A sorting domain-containing protein [Flavobacterium sp. UBA6031]|uniref:Periplasmic ligand-binding sensor domain-containing protein n=1 Tax=Flavobacterium sp. UBA6031 TaxID=1946551 RepID=UPI0025C6FD04|nr:T9SS type A sorting domain-containing protein [Flavobacterium sp. UBA6031]
MKSKLIITLSLLLSLTANSQTWNVYGYDEQLNDCVAYSHITIFNDTLWSGSSKLDGTTLSGVSAPIQLFTCDLSKSDPTGNLWLVGSIYKDTWTHGDAYTVYKFDGTKWYDYSPPKSVVYNGCSAIAFQNDGKIWFTTTNNGAYMYNGTSWQQYKSSVFTGANSMAIDNSGNKWFATSSGLVKYNGSNWTAFNTSNSGLKFNTVSDLAIDKNGNIWLATGSPDETRDATTGRIAKFDGTNWTYYNPFNDDMGSNFVYSIAVDPNGKIWAGTYSGLTVFDGAKWTNYTDSHTTSTDNLQVLSIDFDSNGNKWFGTTCGILEFDDLTASINSSYSQNEIRIGPNPANSYVNIDLSGQNSNNEISILDVKGLLVLKKTVSSNNVQLNISDFQQGLYFICVNTGSYRIIKKLVKYN